MITVTFSNTNPIVFNPPNSVPQIDAKQIGSSNNAMMNPSSFTLDSAQIKAVHAPKAIKFGIIHPYCGVCPICVAGAAAQKELEAIRHLREGNEDQDLTITEGQAMDNIRRAGKETGAAVESTNIGHEDGSRLQPIALSDLDVFNLAVLPRVYDLDDKTYTIGVNPMHTGKGTENGLFKHLIGGVESIERTFSYDASEDAAPPPVREDLLKGLHKGVHALGLYHHVSEGLEVRTTALSKPLLIGYAGFAKLRPRELFVASARSLPGFEGGGVEAGCLMNAMGMAVKTKDYDSVMVLVEPWQKALKEYLGVLKNEYGFEIQELEPKETPAPYMDFKSELDLPNGAELYRISLNPLKESYANLNADDLGKSSKIANGLQDTKMLRTIALPDPGKAAFYEQQNSGSVIDFFKNPVPLKEIHLERDLPKIVDLMNPVPRRLDTQA